MQLKCMCLCVYDPPSVMPSIANAEGSFHSVCLSTGRRKTPREMLFSQGCYLNQGDLLISVRYFFILGTLPVVQHQILPI